MGDEVVFNRAYRGQRQPRGDEAVVRLAEAQYGVISRAQLVALGLGPDAIDRLIRRKRLHPLHRGIYAVGQRQLRREAKWMAAVLAYGPGTVLSHLAGGAHWQLVWDRGVIEVTCSRALRARSGIRVHKARLPADEITTHQGIPVTTVPRTLFDLAAVLPQRQLERAINEAEVLHLWDELSLDRLLHRYPRHKGNNAVRAALQQRRQGSSVTKSELEEMFLALTDAAGIPRPEINVLVESFEVDAVWRDVRLVVELDGRDTHGTAAAFERDRAPRAVIDDVHRLRAAGRLAA